jgi:hypothetical protein
MRIPSEQELIEYQLEIDRFIQRSKTLKLADGSLTEQTELDRRIEAGPAIGALLLKAAISIGAGMILNFVASKILSANKKDKSNEQKKYAPNYGFDEGGAIPESSQLVPLIYCNRRRNPFGGFRANGYLLHSRIETKLGLSELFQLHALSMGRLGEINTNKAIIAEQPRDLYSDRDVNLQSRNGAIDQGTIDWFPFFSQVISPPNYNQFGVDYRTSFKTPGWSSIDGLNYTLDRSEDYEALDSGDEYMVGGEPSDPPSLFAIVAKDEANKRITIDPAYTFSGTPPIYSYWRAKYETTRPVTRLDLNLVFNLSSIDRDGNEKEFGAAFDLYIGDVGSASNPDDFLNTNPVPLRRVVRFFVRSYNPNGIRRQIQIHDLPLGRYRLELRPIPTFANQFAIELGSNGTLTEYPYSVPIAGQFRTIRILCESKGIASPETIQAAIIETNRRQMSSDNGATGRLSSVNEIVNPSAIALPIPTYSGLALLAARLRASQRLSQPPATEALIVQGIECWNWILAGICTADGPNLIDVNKNFTTAVNWTMATGFAVFNLDRRQSALVNGVVNGGIVSSIQWKAGDRYAIAFWASSNYFPDIFVDILRRQGNEGGLGSLFDADRLVDYESIVTARSFVASRGFFFDGAIIQPTAFTSWAEQTARLSMLMCTTVGSRLGLRPIRNDNPVMTINNANCRNFTFQAADWIDHQINTVIVKHRDGRSEWQTAGLRFRPVSTTIMTADARNNIVPIAKVEIDADSVTHPNQVQTIGCFTLRSSQLQDCTCSFELDWIASYLQPGDILRAQTEALVLRDELSGIVTAIDNNAFILSREPLLLRGEFDNESFMRRDRLICNPTAIDIGDLIRIRHSDNSLSEPSRITAVNNDSITFSPALNCEPYAEFEILDCTFDRLFCSITINGQNFDNRSLSFVKYDRGKVWIAISGIKPVVGSPAIVYRKDSKITLWQINTMEPIEGYGAKVSCVIWNSGITQDYSGLWIRTAEGERQV